LLAKPGARDSLPLGQGEAGLREAQADLLDKDFSRAAVQLEAEARNMTEDEEELPAGCARSCAGPG
jgi:hypothetical protein